MAALPLPIARTALALALCLLPPLAAGGRAADSPAGTGIITAPALAEFGTPKYPTGFARFDYVDPAAPKGGGVITAEEGSFDSLNPIILRGVVPRTLGLAYDTLMVPSGDELNVVYGLIAESADYPADHSWITFTLRDGARWHDGVPITTDDVAWTFDQIRSVGQPFLRSFYQDVTGYKVIDRRRITFSFTGPGTMKPLVQLAGLTPLPKHWWTAPGRDISRTTLDPVLTSGPYRIADIDAGRSITYRRVADYWGRDLPVNIGQNNFDSVRVDYYRDDDIMFEAFKAGNIDLRQELRARRWATGYDIAPVRDGRMLKRALPDERPTGIQGFFFNTRRAKFADPRVRQAIGLLFDFEWIQKNLLYGLYRRASSFFPNSDFGASGPPTAAELALLEPYRDRLPPALFTEAFQPPRTDGSGNIRANLRQALTLLTAAGWTLRDGRLVDGRGEALTIEFLVDQPAFNRLIEPFIANLKNAGITGVIRPVDSAQYQVRLNEFDFDIISVHLNFFPPPGTEQRSYFGSAEADLKGSANYAGIKNPVVDALIEQVVRATDLDTLKTASRALDRVLSWDYAVIPQWYNDETWYAHWNRFGWPATKPRYDSGFPATWWYDAAKAAPADAAKAAPAVVR